MKVIVTGSTGFIGQEVLKQCVESSLITSVVALSRRPPAVPEAANPKVKIVLVEDFLTYPPDVIREIQGAEACIWALGKALAPDPEEAKRINLDYTLAAARAFTDQIVPQGGSQKRFRFVYLSGGAAERDQEKSLWVLGTNRKIRGQVENELLEQSRRNSDKFEVCIMKPGFVLKEGFDFRDLAKGFMPSVKLGALAKVMTNVACNGCQDDTLDNAAIALRGQ